MNLLQLFYFVNVATGKNMTKVSETLHVSQSTLSMSIKKLEEEYSISLFQKNGRNLELTTEGEFLLEKAKDIINSVDNLDSELKIIGNKSKPQINICGDVSDAMIIGSDLMSKFYTNYIFKNIRANIDSVQSLLISNKSNIGITSFEFKQHDLLSYKILEDKQLLIVNKNHPFAKKSTILKSDLNGETFITMPKGYSLRAIYDNLFKLNAIKIGNYEEVFELESIGLAIDRGDGISFIPESVYNQKTDIPHYPLLNTVEVIIKDLDFYRPVYLSCKTPYNETKDFENILNFYLNFGSTATILHRYPEEDEIHI